MYYYPQQPQMQMVGQVLPIGYSGYNQQQQYNPYGYGYNGYGNSGGYYTGNYYNFNPYAYQQQQQQYIQQQQAAEREQAEIMKKVYRCACSFQGREATDYELEYYDYGRSYYDPRPKGEDVSGLTQEQQMRYYQLLNYDIGVQQSIQNAARYAATPTNAYITPAQAYCMRVAKMQQEERAKIPDNIGLVEYMNKYAPQQHREAVEFLQQREQSTNKLYNREQYRASLDKERTGSNLFGSLNPNANIDDQEIRLPSYISEEQRQQRRKLFMQTIFAQMKPKGG